jgi:hypothetical protein
MSVIKTEKDALESHLQDKEHHFWGLRGVISTDIINRKRREKMLIIKTVLYELPYAKKKIFKWDYREIQIPHDKAIL